MTLSEPGASLAVRGPRGEGGSLTRYLLLVCGVLALFLVVFLVAEAFSLPLLDDPASWLSSGGVLAGVAGVGLLIADVVLPVPSSLVMVVHGALFGVAIGTALSLLGGVGSALAGYGLGRVGGRPLLRSACSEVQRTGPISSCADGDCWP